MIDKKMLQKLQERSNCAVIVAGPDDETLWTGGMFMMYPQVRWFVVSLCGKSDPDRSAKFFRAMEFYRAAGTMGDLGDGPEQKPLSQKLIHDKIISLLPRNNFDLVITHSILGEYTSQRRGQETAKAVLELSRSESLFAGQIWSFSYEDGGGKYLPRHIRDSDIITHLSDEIWEKKYRVISEIYGFGPDSFEAKTTPRIEAFNCFKKGGR